MIDLIGADVRDDGRVHSLALEASGVVARQQFMLTKKGIEAGRMRRRKWCSTIIDIYEDLQMLVMSELAEMEDGGQIRREGERR